jgi:hypothetical protein
MVPFRLEFVEGFVAGSNDSRHMRPESLGREALILAKLEAAVNNECAKRLIPLTQCCTGGTEFVYIGGAPVSRTEM